MMVQVQGLQSISTIFMELLQELFPGLNGQEGSICLLLTYLESGNKQKQNLNTIWPDNLAISDPPRWYN